jgi:hypothetical protein
MEWINAINPNIIPALLAVLQILGGICIVATGAAQLTKKGGDKVAVANSWFSKLILFLPTLGVNPQTQKLMEALKELQEKK